MKKLAPLFIFLIFGFNLQAQDIKSLADCMVSDCNEFFKPSPYADYKNVNSVNLSRHLNIKIENVENEHDDLSYAYDQDQYDIQDNGRQLIDVIGATVRLEKSFQAKDKQLHFRAGSIIGHISGEACESGLISIAIRGKSLQQRKFFCALSGATVAGILKELYDSTDRENHTVDAKDAIATALGAFTQVTLYKLEF